MVVFLDTHVIVSDGSISEGIHMVPIREPIVS